LPGLAARLADGDLDLADFAEPGLDLSQAGLDLADVAAALTGGDVMGDDGKMSYVGRFDER
jgi:hypothetical protein